MSQHRHRLMVAAALLISASLPTACAVAVAADGSAPVAQDAQAEAWSSWTRPVVTRISIGTYDDGRWTEIDPGRELELAPRQTVQLEIVGTDQYGRRFPPERLAFGTESRGCSGIVELDDGGGGRFSARAGTRTGRCLVLFWVPGNLNLIWEMAFVVDPRARTSYSRAEAEFVAGSLYLGLLDREPDAEGLRQAILEIQRGQLDSFVEAMTRSAEFRSSLQGLDAGEFLDRLYRGLLGREPDSPGVRLYLPLVQQRRHAEVALRLIRSEEFERRLAEHAGS